MFNDDIGFLVVSAFREGRVRADRDDGESVDRRNCALFRALAYSQDESYERWQFSSISRIMPVEEELCLTMTSGFLLSPQAENGAYVPIGMIVKVSIGGVERCSELWRIRRTNRTSDGNFRRFQGLCQWRKNRV